MVIILYLLFYYLFTILCTCNFPQQIWHLFPFASQRPQVGLIQLKQSLLDFFIAGQKVIIEWNGVDLVATVTKAAEDPVIVISWSFRTIEEAIVERGTFGKMKGVRLISYESSRAPSQGNYLDHILQSPEIYNL